ncbi:hypothetical protein BU17DRAFT_97890 [Hysterangium stoloniferum]|nr:hypothetical protein BU17DRAFT_97890 [Hysterangium stoloniferum]
MKPIFELTPSQVGRSPHSCMTASIPFSCLVKNHDQLALVSSTLLLISIPAVPDADIHMGREVHALYEHEESDWRAHMYKASLIQVFDGKRKAMNFLGIPTAVSLHPPAILLIISYDILAGNRAMNDMVGFPQYMTRWRLCATEGALSRAHIDAGKFGTWIHMVHGTKLWVVISGDIVETSLEDLDYTAHKWTYYLLEPGDQLFMPAGTIHAVMTLNDSWVEGGHFYGQNSLHRSFSAGLREHRQGLTDCNTEHPESEYVLHALLETYHGILLSYFPDIHGGWAGDSNPRAYEEVLNHWPPLEELAYLLIMTGHAHHFEPEAMEGETYHCSQVIIPTPEKSLERIFSIFNFCPEVKNQVRWIEREMSGYLNLTGDKTLDSLCDAEGVLITWDEMDLDVI